MARLTDSEIQARAVNWLMSGGNRGVLFGMVGILDVNETTWLIDVNDEPGFIHVRVLGSSGSEPVSTDRAFNSKVIPVPDTPVRMRRNSSGTLVVEGIEQELAKELYGDYVTNSDVGAHHHRRGGGVEQIVEMEVLEAGLVVPLDTTSLVVRVYPFAYATASNNNASFDGGTIDLDSHEPSDTGMQRFVLVCLDTTDNTLVLVDGADKASVLPPLRSDISAITVSDDYITLCAVRLVTGQTTFTSYADFVDWRHWLTGANTGGGSSPWTTNSNVVNLVTDGDTVTIGSATAGGKLFVDGDADEVQLQVQGNGTQTSLLAVFENSSGDDQVTISGTGAAVFNEQGNDADFRVEGDTSANALVVDASQDAVGVGTATPDASAILDVSSTTKGFAPPRMTTAERTAIASPVDGLIVYDTTLDRLYQRQNGAWVGIGAFYQTIQDQGGTLYTQRPIMRFTDVVGLTWVIVDVGPETLLIPTLQTFVGADASNDGAVGIVPAPVAGEEAYVLLGSGLWGTIPPPPFPYAVLQHQLSNNTAGGASSSGAWTTRPLNTEVVDADAIVSLSSNQFTPIAGTYLLFAEATFTQHATNNGTGRLRLRETNTPATVYTGANYRMLQNQGVQMFIDGIKFTADGADAYELQYYLTQARASDGLGLAVNEGVGTVETYATVILVKVG